MQMRNVLLLLDLQHYGRSIIEGVLRHARAHPEWRCHVDGWGERTAWRVDAIRRFDGIIALVRGDDQAAILQAACRPVVNVSNFRAGKVLPSVVTDDHAVGRLGAQWLLARGWRQLAYIGGSNADYAHERCAGFSEQAAAAGVPVSTLLPTAGCGFGPPSGLETFLSSVVRPTAVLAANDYVARQVALVARETGISIPSSLALVGVDDDALVCELTSPPLASIAIDGVGIGQAAACLLDRLMAGEPPPPDITRIPPLRLVPRLSVDAIAIDDPDLSAAWRCIHARALEGIGVDVVVATAHLSRSVLEKRFQAAFSTTIGVELRRLRLAEARRLLASTDLHLGRVARACGFSNAKQLGAAFVHDTGETMGAWRARHRGPAG